MDPRNAPIAAHGEGAELYRSGVPLRRLVHHATENSSVFKQCLLVMPTAWAERCLRDGWLAEEALDLDK